MPARSFLSMSVRYLSAWGATLSLLSVSLITTKSHGIITTWGAGKNITSTDREKPFRLPIFIHIDTDHPIGPISPRIYGMALTTDVHYRELEVPVTRWGGNPNSRYNWEKGNCWNAARDWRFANVNYGNTATDLKRPSGVADQFVANVHQRRVLPAHHPYARVGCPR